MKGFIKSLPVDPYAFIHPVIFLFPGVYTDHSKKLVNRQTLKYENYVWHKTMCQEP